MGKLLLIDGNSILNRAFFGIRPLITKAGLFTHAVYGMMNILLGHIEREKPDHIACAFDLKAKTFRHLMYDGYKANRHGMPEELAVQLPYAKKMVAALGIPIVELEGYEADDVIGTASAFSDSDPELEVDIVTGDRDSFQLIRDNVFVLLASTGETIRFDRTLFGEKYGGTTPEQFPDVKALMGDSSDNIPGVPGIGEKTAVKLIADYGSVDGVYEALPTAKLTPSVLKKLTEGKESAELSRKLALICREAPIGVGPDDLIYRGVDRAALTALLTELELFSSLKRVEKLLSDGVLTDAGAGKKADAASVPKPDAPLPDLSSVPSDLPLSDLPLPDRFEGYVGVSAPSEDGTLTVFDGETRYRGSVRSPFFSDPEAKIIARDSKALYRFMGENGLSPASLLLDIRLAAYVLSPGEGGYELPRLSLAYLGESVELPEEVAVYRLYPVLAELLERNGEDKLYREIELPLSRVLADMERTGFRVDRDGLKIFGDKLNELAASYQESVWFAAGHEFNIGSPKQLSEVLFDEMCLPPPTKKKNKAGHYSTDAETLEKLRPYAPIVDSILEYRQVTKLRSTYADGLIREADENGRIHSVFHQTVTATGRLSSAEPNLQNIPIRTELGKEFRRYFLPSDADHVLIDADYSQIELRLLAAISADETMLSAYERGDDIHAITASQVFGVPLAAVTPELRKRAKAVNFGIVYGISDFSLAQDIHVTKKQAADYIDRYFAHYPNVRRYMDETVKRAREEGYVTTLFGRRRPIPELSAQKKTMQAFGERVAMNSPIQGTAADIIKIAMIRVDRALRESGLDARLILQVHDELILEASRKDAPRAAEILRHEMENAVTLPVALPVELGTGDTWFDC
ncbi:MAG: DNA polymerase I [Lachnospiraceae bacterium]|nr:DNA polymerase I [Lachnospiraceae bacterium]